MYKSCRRKKSVIEKCKVFIVLVKIEGECGYSSLAGSAVFANPALIESMVGASTIHWRAIYSIEVLFVERRIFYGIR